MGAPSAKGKMRNKKLSKSNIEHSTIISWHILVVLATWTTTTLLLLLLSIMNYPYRNSVDLPLSGRWFISHLSFSISCNKLFLHDTNRIYVLQILQEFCGDGTRKIVLRTLCNISSETNDQSHVRLCIYSSGGYRNLEKEATTERGGTSPKCQKVLAVFVFKSYVLLAFDCKFRGKREWAASISFTVHVSVAEDLE
jgi:hypothetical protein